MTNSIEGQSIFCSSDDEISAVFGSHSHFFLDVVRNILPNVLSAKYHFLDNEPFQKAISSGEYSIESINRIIWTETLYLCHIVTSTSLLRTCRLIDATSRLYTDRNLPGWASCARALLESTGDSVDALLAIPRTLAENHRSISRRISGQVGNYIYTAKELEDILFHYTHARKIMGRRGQIPTVSQEAKPTYKYIENLERFGMSNVKELYKYLCEFSHPAAASVQYMFSQDGDKNAFHISQTNDREQINWILQEYRSELDDLLMIAFNPIFVSLRVFHKFKIFPKIPELRRVRFDDIAAWTKIEPFLRS